MSERLVTPELAIQLILYAMTSTSGLIAFTVLVAWKHKLAQKLALVMAGCAINGLLNAVLLVAKAVDGANDWHNWVYVAGGAISATVTTSLAISLLKGPDNGPN